MGREGFETEFVRDKNSLRQVRVALRKRDRSIKLIVPVCFGGCSPERRWKIGDVDDVYDVVTI